MRTARTYGRLVLAALALALLAPAAASGDDVILNLEGIAGDAKLDGFKDALLINSFQFGVAKSKDKPANFSDVVFTKGLDSATPHLMLRAASGELISKGKLTFRRATDGKPFTYLEYCFTGLRVTSFTQSSGGDAPAESFSLSYATVVQKYTSQLGDGSAGPFEITGWDLIKNLQFGNPTC